MPSTSRSVAASPAILESDAGMGWAAPTLPIAWLPTACAPTRFPVRVLHGAVLLDDGRHVALPMQPVVNNGWGVHGSVDVAGPVGTALPVALALTWFSFAEAVTYGAHVVLPQEHVRDLFSIGTRSPRTGARLAYNRLIVGMGPGGVGALWVAGEGLVVSVSTFTASAIATDIADLIAEPPEAFITSHLRMALSPTDLAEQEAFGAPRVDWARYGRVHAWSPALRGSYQSVRLWMQCANGEQEFFDLSGNAPTPACRPRGAPRDIVALLNGACGTVRLHAALGDAAFRLFERLSVAAGDEPMTLAIELRPDGALRLTLHAGDASALLPMRHR